MLPDHEFQELIRNGPLTSIDFIIENDADEILLGLRNNEPAKGFWFAPGGRIFKNETIKAAMARIFRTETGAALPQGKIELLGAFDHLYDNNVFGRDGFGTHYVVLAHKVRAPAGAIGTGDDQHEAFRWWRREEALASSCVHEYTKAYFK